MTYTPSTHPFIKAASERTLLFDGAMGTILLQKGLRGSSADYWTLQYPDEIYAVHRAYADLGVDAIETNTFGSGAIKLAKAGLQDYAQQIIHKAVALAKQASDGRCFVSGAVGPTGELLAPLGNLTREDCYDNYVEHISRLIGEGADTILIESMPDLAQTRIAVLAANAVRAQKGFLPILISLTYNPDGKTMMGDTPEAAACIAQHLGVDMVGLNCSAGPDELFPTFLKLVENCSVPVFAMPNAGLPYVENGTTMFPFSSEQMAQSMKPYLAQGAHIGGCCGTTPEHIALLRKLVDQTPKASPPRPDISDVFCSLRLTARLCDIPSAPVVELRGSDAGNAAAAVMEIDGPLALVDLGDLSKEQTDSVLREALPILPGTALAFRTRSAQQAEAALWLFDGIAAISPVDDIDATRNVAERFGARIF